MPYKVNDRATFSATNGEVDLGGTQIFFETAGTLEINAYSAGVKQDQIDYLINDWGASDTDELLAWINDDEGTSYVSMDEYFADNTIYKPMLVNLKGGDYVSKVFSDGTAVTTDTSTLPIMNNGFLAFGNGLESSITNYGMLKQPLYYDTTAQRWYRLTYSDYPMDIMIGVGGSSYNDGDLYDTGEAQNDLASAVSNLSVNLSQFSNNTGTISVTMDVTTSAGVLPITQSYTLDSGAKFVKATTSLSNTTDSDVDNARLWIGTQDDYVAMSDSNYKTRGNIGSSGFEAVANQSSDPAKALIVSENALDSGEGAAILFYSTTNGTNTIVSGDYGWENIVDADPTSMDDVSQSAEDGSYALYLNLGQFANGTSGSVTWYYAAAPVSELSSMVSQVGQSAGVTPSTPSTPSTPTPEPEQQQQQVNNIVTTIVNSTTVTPPAPIVLAPLAPQPQQVQTLAQNNTLLQSILPQGTTGSGGSFGLVGSTDGTSPVQTITMEQLQTSALAQGMGEIRVPLANNSLVELVNGGVTLPKGVTQEFYVVDNSANSGRAQNVGQDDQDKKTKKN